MSVLERISSRQGRRDEAANVALARELASARDKKGVREIAENLWNKDANIQTDCIKVLYEIGTLDPKLIAPYMGDYLKLLESKNNRLVWGGMTALATVAPIAADEIFAQYAKLVDVIERGSVITWDKGIKTLALVAAHSDKASKKIFPYLMQTLETCRPKEIPQYAESIVPAVNIKNRAQFAQAIETRLPDMPASRATRIRRVLKQVNELK